MINIITQFMIFRVLYLDCAIIIMKAVTYLSKADRVRNRKLENLDFLWDNWEKITQETLCRDQAICCSIENCNCVILEDKRIAQHPNGLYEKHKWRKPNVRARNYRYDLVLNRQGQIMVIFVNFKN